MTELRIAYERDGYRLMLSADGRHERPFGPLWPTPKAAGRFYDTYAANHPQRVAPLRSSEEDPEGLADEGFIARSSLDRSGSPLPADPGPSSTARGRRLGDPDNPSPIQGAGHSCSLGGIPARRVGRAAPPPEVWTESELRYASGDR